MMHFAQTVDKNGKKMRENRKSWEQTLIDKIQNVLITAGLGQTGSDQRLLITKTTNEIRLTDLID